MKMSMVTNTAEHTDDDFQVFFLFFFHIVGAASCEHLNPLREANPHLCTASFFGRGGGCMCAAKSSTFGNIYAL